MPFDHATALPAACYTSTEFFAAEMVAIHRRNWFFVGLASELASPGAYRAIETVGGPVILLRDNDGGLRAFANCCRHRGSILLEGSGRIRSIACPYHAWTYRLDGALIAAPDMERTPDFDLTEHGLARVRLETWQDLVFLNFDEAAPRQDAHHLADHLRPGGYRHKGRDEARMHDIKFPICEREELERIRRLKAEVGGKLAAWPQHFQCAL